MICACAPNLAVYESPTLGPLSDITFVNAAKAQAASLVTFVDGTTCTGKRQIRFENDAAVPPGESRTLSVSAGREFALFATLPTIEDEEFGVDLGVTGSGPSPVTRRTVAAIGCNANVSFEIEPQHAYQILIAEPTASRLCSVAVSRIDKEGEVVAIEPTARIARSPRDSLGPFCEPVAK